MAKFNKVKLCCFNRYSDNSTDFLSSEEMSFEHASLFREYLLTRGYEYFDGDGSPCYRFSVPHSTILCYVEYYFYIV